MTTLDLAPAHLRILRDLLAQHLPEAEVLAYGSRINGGSHAGSDVDLAARHPSTGRLGSQKLTALRTALSESNLPMIVQVQDWARLSESFQHEIARASVVVQRAALPAG